MGGRGSPPQVDSFLPSCFPSAGYHVPRFACFCTKLQKSLQKPGMGCEARQPRLAVIPLVEALDFCVKMAAAILAVTPSILSANKGSKPPRSLRRCPGSLCGTHRAFGHAELRGGQKRLERSFIVDLPLQKHKGREVAGHANLELLPRNNRCAAMFKNHAL